MTHVEDRLPSPATSRSAVGGSMTDVAGKKGSALPWRRAAKYAAGMALLSVGALTTYQNVVVRSSREAVLNGRTVSVRAPMDGILTTSLATAGSVIQGGMSMGRVEDPRPDDARAFALQQDIAAV